MIPGTQEYISERQAIARGKVAECGSPNCAGCYEVADGINVHPPKSSTEYQSWEGRWERIAARKAVKAMPEPKKARKKK